MSQSTDIQALLFDLGGIVINVNFDKLMQRFLGMSSLSADEVRSAFHIDDEYKQYECGRLSSAEYFEHLRTRFRLQCSHDQIADAWSTVFAGTIPESLAAINKARSRFPCYAFTNSNSFHQAIWTKAYPAVIEAFDQIYVSSDLGLRKPEQAAFHAVADAMGVKPEAILFFDDTRENVLGANKAGLKAIHVQHPADLSEGLKLAGCW